MPRRCGSTSRTSSPRPSAPPSDRACGSCSRTCSRTRTTSTASHGRWRRQRRRRSSNSPVSGPGTVTAEPPPPDAGEPGAWRKYALAAGFLAPAAFFLGVWIVYPTIRTIFRSFFSADGDEFVWFDNYEQLFTTDTLVTAIQNNAIWVAVVPAAVTAIGLIFAVLTERIRWSVAFKTVVFMPMAISAFAAGVTWRIMYVQDPDQGAVNAGIRAVKDTISEPGVLSQAAPSSDDLQPTPDGGIELQNTVEPGQTATLGLTRIPNDEVPEDAVQAVRPEALQGGINGVVWRDFKPGGGTPGEVEPDELGLPGVTVELLDSGGGKVESTSSDKDGTFAFESVEPGDYRLKIG